MGNNALSMRICMAILMALLIGGCRTGAGPRSASTVKTPDEFSLASQEVSQPIDASQADEPREGETSSTPLADLPQVAEPDVDALISLVNSELANGEEGAENNKENSEETEVLTGQLELTVLNAIHMAMQNSETLRVSSGVSGTTAAATAYDQAIVSTAVQEEFGFFDTQLDWTTGWNRVDQPPGLTTDGAFLNRNQLDRADLASSLTKRLYSGGVAAIEYDTRYTFFPGAAPAGFLNPQYFTPLTFRFAQPLLRDKGRAVNLAPIEIAKIESKQSTWDFKQAALESVRDIEGAYWQVYAAEAEVKALEGVLPLFKEVVRINRERVAAEAAAQVDADQAATKLWQAERTLAEAELRLADSLNLLRNLLGFGPSDQREVVLVSQPIEQSIVIDWHESLGVAMQERPDVVRQRLSVRIRSLEQTLAENGKKIRLDGVAAWRINGLGTDLIEAWDVLGDNDYTDWELGFQVSVPLGRNTARARLRAANLNYRREVSLLQQTTHTAGHDIAEKIRSVYSLYEQLQAAEKELHFAERWMSASRERYLDPALAGSKLADLNNYLLSLRNAAQAKSIYAGRVGLYNASLATLEVSTGTLLDSRLVSLSFNSCHAATHLFETSNYNPLSLLGESEAIVPEVAPADPNEEVLPVPDTDTK